MVDVDEIALANAFQSSLAADEARPSGAVSLVRPGSDDVFDSWTVSASAIEGETLITGDADVAVVQPLQRRVLRGRGPGLRQRRQGQLARAGAELRSCRPGRGVRRNKQARRARFSLDLARRIRFARRACRPS